MWWKIILAILIPPLGIIFLIWIAIEEYAPKRTKIENNHSIYSENYYIILPNQNIPTDEVENKLNKILNSLLEGEPYTKGNYTREIQEQGLFALCYSNVHSDLEVVAHELYKASIIYEIISEEEYQAMSSEIQNDLNFENNEYQNALRILGVYENSSIEDIKKAFRTMAKKYHPDLNSSQDAEEKFKEINEAYNLLKTKMNFN